MGVPCNRFRLRPSITLRASSSPLLWPPMWLIWGWGRLRLARVAMRSRMALFLSPGLREDEEMVVTLLTRPCSAVRAWVCGGDVSSLEEEETVEDTTFSAEVDVAVVTPI